MDMPMSKEFEAKLDSESQIIAMQDYIEDIHSQMRKLKEERDLEVLHRLLPESEKPLQIADHHLKQR